MRRVFLFALAIALLGSCDLYQIDPPVNIDFPNLQPYYSQSQISIDYIIRGAFYVDVQVQRLNEQLEWIELPQMGQRLVQTRGTLSWDESLTNTTYKLICRAVASRSGLNKVLDPPIREVTFNVVLQPMLILNISLKPGSMVKSGVVPVSVQFVVKGYGIRPGSVLLLLDTTFRPIFYSEPYSSYLTYMPNIVVPAVYAYGFGSKTSDLGGGLEEWTYTINFAHNMPPYALNGVDEFVAGETIYLMLLGITEVDYNVLASLNLTHPNPFPNVLISWHHITWL